MIAGVPAFSGFPPEAVEFLRELEANNDRGWFKANRSRYDEHLVAPAAALGAGLELNEPDLVRAPRGYAADHPRVDLLRRRRLTVARRHELGPWLHRPGAGARIRSELDAAAPLVRWLREHVGPPQHAPAH